MTRLLPVVVLIAACGPEETNDGFTTTETTTDEGVCVLVEERVLTVDEVAPVPLNFSAQNALDEVTGVPNHTNVVEYPDASTINLEVEFVYNGGTITYRERDAQGALDQVQLAKCFTAVEIEGEFTFVTGDGLFNETWTGVLQAHKRRESKFVVSTDALTGAWTPEDSGLDSATLGSPTFEFSGMIDVTSSSGTMTAVSGDDRSHMGIWLPSPTGG